MRNALDVVRAAIAASPTSYVTSTGSQCQRLVGNTWEADKGRITPNNYARAIYAYDDSVIAKNGDGSIMGPNTAPVGSIPYFNYSIYGHVGIIVGYLNGRAVMASATGWSTNNIGSLGKGVWLHYVDDYARHLTFLGWSRTNGAREAITDLVDAWAPVLAANQRKVKPNADARRRSAPRTADDAGQPLSNFDPTASFKANTVVTPSGFVRSSLIGGQPAGSDRWLFVDGLFSHVSAFTDTDTHDLADLGWVAPPPVLHSVTIVYNPTESKTVEIVDGNLLSEPVAPARDDFLFEGWAFDGALYDFATPVTSNFTLEALWTAKPPPVEPPPEPGEPTDEAAPAWWVAFWRAVIDFLTTLFKAKG